MKDIESTIRTAAEEGRRVMVRYRTYGAERFQCDVGPYVLGESDILPNVTARRHEERTA